MEIIKPIFYGEVLYAKDYHGMPAITIRFSEHDFFLL